MRIRVNGETVELAGPLTVSALLAQYGIDPRRVAVERNQQVVKRAAYDATPVVEGDEIEIVNFVGGGAERRVPRTVRPLGSFLPVEHTSGGRDIRS